MNLDKTSLRLHKAIHEIYIFFKKNKINNESSRVKALQAFVHYFKIDYLQHKNYKLFISKHQHAQNINLLISIVQATRKMSFIKSENEINRLLVMFITPLQNQTNFSIQHMRKLEEACYYIKYDRNDQNILFPYQAAQNKFLISINVSKPEQLVNNKSDLIGNSEPQCSICLENVGWRGSAHKSSRENLIIQKIELNHENWFVQFSPYEYFKNHVIIINEVHVKMKLDQKVITRFYDFINQNPGYFIGSNSGLKYIGGSILEHDHYQAGQVILPVMKARSIFTITCKQATIEVLDWPASTIKIKSHDIVVLETIYWDLFQTWKKTNLKNLINKHNHGFSLIFKKIGHEYGVWITYRNNAISPARPLGIFHVNPQRQNIKQESMGLIEISGLAILPGRLKHELGTIIRLWNRKKYAIIKKHHRLAKHYQWICKYASQNHTLNWQSMQKYLGITFEKCIADCSVFKTKSTFINYLEQCTNCFD